MFDVPDSAGVNRWPVLKVRAGGKAEAVLLGTRFLPLSSHWVGHTLPCPGDGCQLCEVLPLRGQFYLPISVSGRATILELSAVAANNLEQHAKFMHGGLAVGQKFEFSRRSAKAPLHAEIIEQIDDITGVPFVVFVSRVMALYHLPPSNPGESVEKYGERLRSVSSIRAAREYEKQIKRAASSHAS